MAECLSTYLLEFITGTQTRRRRARIAAGGDYPGEAERCHQFAAFLTPCSNGAITAMCHACCLCPRDACQLEEQLHWPVFLSHGMSLCRTASPETLDAMLILGHRRARSSEVECAPSQPAWKEQQSTETPSEK